MIWNQKYLPLSHCCNNIFFICTWVNTNNQTGLRRKATKKDVSFMSRIRPLSSTRISLFSTVEGLKKEIYLCAHSSFSILFFKLSTFRFKSSCLFPKVWMDRDATFKSLVICFTLESTSEDFSSKRSTASKDVLKDKNLVKI